MKVKRVLSAVKELHSVERLLVEARRKLTEEFEWYSTDVEEMQKLDAVFNPLIEAVGIVTNKSADIFIDIVGELDIPPKKLGIDY